MDRRRMAIFLLVGIAAVSVTRSGAGADTGVNWQTDYAEAQKIRADKHRPLLVFVTMDGCHFCHKMLSETYSDQTIKATINTHFLPTKINGTRQQDLAQRFGVRIFPTTFFISADNLVVDRVEGFMAPELFRQRVALATSSTTR